MIKAIAIDDEPLALKIIQLLCSQHEAVDLLKAFTQPNEALAYLANSEVDLIFCDIQMPSMTGISLVKLLPQKAMVIFTTAYSEYAATSYDLNAIDYLLKPINQKRFTQAINKALEYYNYLHQKNNTAHEHIFVRADFSLVKIPISDICYIEGLADYLKIHIIDRKPVVTRMTMKEMIGKLPASEFIRIHRSFILPFNKIESVRGNNIYMGTKMFPIGRTYTEDFYSRYHPK